MRLYSWSNDCVLKKILNYIPVILMVVMLLFVTACSSKKNTAMSRFWQSFTTRYNVYFNGSEHYKEQLKEMETDYEDNYTKRVYIHPAEAYQHPSEPQPSTNFDRTIEKMQKAIRQHSIKKKPKKKSGKGKDKKYKEWMKREEYNPFLHNAWLMMGKAQYMNGDFMTAAATFHYITGHFKWLPEVVVESRLWEAQCYNALEWTADADNIISRIKEKDLTSGDLRALYNLSMANYQIKVDSAEAALPYLRKAIDHYGGAQKVRLRFLYGQLCAESGRNSEAYMAFKKVNGANGATYRTKFNARIKQSEVYTGHDIEKEVKSLRSMVKYDRNKDYLDQIYYAIGNLYLSRQDTVRAIENYVLAAEESTRNGIEKAISQLTLGAIYFKQGRYDLAQPCYAEAVPIIGEEYAGYDSLKKRSDVLDELAVYAQNVELQDSLLRLSAMTPDEQKAVAEKLIAELKKQEEEAAEEARREEYLAQQAAQGSMLGNNANAPTTFTLNTDDSWYFYNTTTKNAGKTAFQKAWGSRKLEDDWRRRNKATFSMSEFDEVDYDNMDEDGNIIGGGMAADSTAVNADSLKRADDPHYVEYYLKQIPKTDEERQTCNDIIQEGLFNMGVILKDRLEDFPGSITQFNTLLTRYPDNIYRLDTYYNMYLMYVRMGNMAQAETYRQLIITDFADSGYGQAMKDPNYIDNLRNMEREQEQMYAAAYDDYINNRNENVHEAYAEMMRRYPLSKIMPKFMFIDALSYLTEKNYDKFKSTLREMLERYPETDITPTASSIMRQIAQGRKLEGGGSNLRGMFWATRLTNDSVVLNDTSTQVTPFKWEPQSPHYYVLAFPRDSVSENQLLFDIARHNFSTFEIKDFDLEQMSFGNIGLLVIKGFDNFDELVGYKTLLESDSRLNIPANVQHVMISVANFNLLIDEGRSLEEYFEYMEELNQEQGDAMMSDDDNAGNGAADAGDGADVTDNGDESQATADSDEATENSNAVGHDSIPQ